MPPAFLPAYNPDLVIFTANSFLALGAFYYGVEYYLGLKGKHHTDREKSWVLTAVSSAIMTACSLPYVYTYFASGQVLEGGEWTDKACCFFIAYLLADLIIGSIHYRSSINLLTGWIHHTLYITLLTLLIIPNSFSSFFTTCCILELPTLLLALGSLNSNLRNDYLFASTFFATRICLHLYLVTVTAIEALGSGVAEEGSAAVGVVVGRGDGGGGGGGDWTRPTCLALAFPMHALWMKDCIRGILRRRRLLLSQLSQTPQTPQLSQSTGGLTQVLLVEPSRVRDIPAYLLARVRSSSSRRLRSGRYHFVRVLCGVLDESLPSPSVVSSPAVSSSSPTHPPLPAPHCPPPPHRPHPTTNSDILVQVDLDAPRWRSLRRRVVGRLKRSLPEYEYECEFGGPVEVGVGVEGCE